MIDDVLGGVDFQGGAHDNDEVGFWTVLGKAVLVVDFEVLAEEDDVWLDGINRGYHTGREGEAHFHHAPDDVGTAFFGVLLVALVVRTSALSRFLALPNLAAPGLGGLLGASAAVGNLAFGGLHLVDVADGFNAAFHAGELGGRPVHLDNLVLYDTGLELKVIDILGVHGEEFSLILEGPEKSVGKGDAFEFWHQFVGEGVEDRRV